MEITSPKGGLKIASRKKDSLLQDSLQEWLYHFTDSVFRSKGLESPITRDTLQEEPSMTDTLIYEQTEAQASITIPKP